MITAYDLAKFGVARHDGNTYPDMLHRSVAEFPAGGSDDTAQIQAAYTWLGGGSYRSLEFEHKQYTISSQCALSGASQFRIYGNGASIKSANGASAGAGTQMLYMTSCVDGVIYDFHLDGNRANRTPAESTNHLFEIYSGCARIDLVFCSADNAVCDGFYVGAQAPVTTANAPTDIRMHWCKADNGYRNSMSVINSVRFRDYDGVYTGANGTAPQAGVDVEPNSSTDVGNVDCQFHRTRFSGNTGYGLQVTLANSFVKCCDIDSSTNLQGAVGLFSAGGVDINGITMNGYTNSITRGLIDGGSGSGYLNVNGVAVNGSNIDDDNKPVIYCHAAMTGPITLANIVQRASKARTIVTSQKITLDGLSVFGDNNGYALTLLTAKNSVIRNVYGEGISALLYCDQKNVDFDNVKLLNPIGATQLMLFSNSATKGSVKNFHVHQDTAVPAGQVGVYFGSSATPLCVSNIIGTCDGTAYTAAQLRNWTGTPSVSNGIFP